PAQLAPGAATTTAGGVATRRDRVQRAGRCGQRRGGMGFPDPVDGLQYRHRATRFLTRRPSARIKGEALPMKISSAIRAALVALTAFAAAALSATAHAESGTVTLTIY